MKERLARKPRAVAFGALLVLTALLGLVAVAANAQSQYPPQTPFVSSLGGRGGGGGLSSAVLDATYLRLDTSNDPLTGTSLSFDNAAGTQGPSIVWDLNGQATFGRMLEAYANNDGSQSRTLQLWLYPTYRDGWSMTGPPSLVGSLSGALGTRSDGIMYIGAGDSRPTASATVDLLCVAAAVGITGNPTVDSRACFNPDGYLTVGKNTAGTDTQYSQASINRASAAHETFSLLNSGAGSIGLTITSDTFAAAADRSLSMTGTFAAGASNPIGIQATFVASTTNANPWGMWLQSGATSFAGAQNSIGALIDNTNDGPVTAEGMFGTHGHHGVEARSYSATNTSNTQAKIGIVGIAWDSSAFNVGLLSQSYGDPGVWTSPGAVNFGNLSTAYNGNNVGGLAVAGFFMLRNGTAGNPAVTTSAALLADNGDQNEDILLLRENGTATMEVANGGVLTGNMASDAVADFCWNGDTVACTLEVDAATDKVNVNQLVSTGGITSTTGNVAASAGNVSGDQFIGDDATLTCAAGVATYNPAAADIVRYVAVDAAGASCVITLGKTNAVLGTTITFYIATSAGVGVVTFPDVAGTHNGPTLCTTTGLVLEGTYSVTFANLATDAYLGTACTQN